MITQRQIDIWRIEAEEYALKIRQQFLDTMMEGRSQQPQPGQMQQPQQPQPGQISPGAIPPEVPQ